MNHLQIGTLLNLLLSCAVDFKDMQQHRGFPFYRAVLKGADRGASNLHKQQAILGLDPGFTPVLPLLADDADQQLLKEEGLHLLCGCVEEEAAEPNGEMFIGSCCRIASPFHHWLMIHYLPSNPKSFEIHM